MSEQSLDVMQLGFISLAYIAEDVYQPMLQGNTRLEPHEWKGGEHLWLIDVVTPLGQREDMLADLKLHLTQLWQIAGEVS